MLNLCFWRSAGIFPNNSFRNSDCSGGCQHSKVYSPNRQSGVFRFCIRNLMGSVILPFMDFNNILLTVSTRFSFWKHAAQLFFRNPLLGNGVGSFRHYQSSLYNNTWYVQCHNTWWQVLSEHGIITAIALAQLLIYLLTHTTSTYKRFLLVLMGVFFCSFEVVYLQIFILVLYVINVARKGDGYAK